MLNTTELQIDSFGDYLEPDETRYLPKTCSIIKNHVEFGCYKFKSLLFCEQDALSYTLFCDLLENDEGCAFDILMSKNVKEMFLNIREYNFSTSTISDEILHIFKPIIDGLFFYYSEQFKHKLNNQKIGE
jgi:hypothetical protein